MATDAVKNATASQIKNLEEMTGKTIGEWTKIVTGSGLEKHGEMVSFLKEKFGMGHGYANLVVHTAKQSHAGFSDDDALIAEQYKGKENLRSWYEALVKEARALGRDLEVSPKKTYVSLRRKKQFAIIQPSTKTRLDIGLNLKEAEATGMLENAGSWNSMCNHRIRIENEASLGEEVFAWLKKAYDQAG